MQQNTADTAESRTPPTFVVIATDEASAKAAQIAGIPAPCAEDLSKVKTDALLKPDNVDCVIVLIAAGASKDEARPVWALTRALREAGNRLVLPPRQAQRIEWLGWLD